MMDYPLNTTIYIAQLEKKYTILIYNLSVLHSLLSPLHSHYDPLLRHNKVTNSNNQ